MVEAMNTLDEITQRLIAALFQEMPEEGIPLDRLRGDKPRIEIPANLLTAALLGDTWPLEDYRILADRVMQHQLNGYWLEYAYGPTDEPVGYYGAVPTAFCAIALTLYHRKTADAAALESAIRAVDVLYFNEDGGYVRKACINKSDVLNTNLLAGLAALLVSGCLPETSVRRRLYREMAYRTVARAIAFQKWNGEFPYNQATLRVSILYQAMSVALLRFFVVDSRDEVIGRAFEHGRRALERLFDAASGRFDWRRATLKDKEGAVWAYSFALLCAAGSDEAAADRYRKRLSELATPSGLLCAGDFDARPDPFYSAWALFGLAYARDGFPSGMSASPRRTWPGAAKLCGLRLLYSIKAMAFVWNYAKRKILNRLLPFGSLDNTSWRKD